MDSNHSGSSSKKGKKSNSDKLKQPQRGIGVAKLEWIRLQTEIAGYIPSLQSNLNMQEEVRPTTAVPSLSSSSVGIAAPSSLFALHPSFMMAYGGAKRCETGCSEFRSLSDQNHGIPSYKCARQTAILPLFEKNIKDSIQKNTQQHGSQSAEPTNPSKPEELDLELRL